MSLDDLGEPISWGIPVRYMSSQLVLAGGTPI